MDNKKVEESIDFLSKRILSGEWRFHRSVTVPELVAFCRTLAHEEQDQLLDLHVRGCSNDEFCIGFKYMMDGDDTSAHEETFHKLREKIQQSFGDKLKGWSISNPTYVILQREI